MALTRAQWAAEAAGKDGKTSSSAAKSTRVYEKVDGQWKLVHANFAPVATDD